MSPLPLKPLGIGINYHPSLHPIIASNMDIFDFIEVSPDVLCEEIQHGDDRGLVLNQHKMIQLKNLSQSLPVIVHGLGLSIGSAHGINTAYTQMLNHFLQHQPALWHSEHLGYIYAQDQYGKEINAGTILPIPLTDAVLNMVVERIHTLHKQIKLPFLIENLTHYLPNDEQNQYTEVAFLNRLSEQSGCGLLLDLYNFFCNSINFKFDPYTALAQLNLTQVTEIHLAGGCSYKGFLLDVHSDQVGTEVWRLLNWILPRCPNLKAVTYEILVQSLDYLGEETILQQIQYARELWQASTNAATPVPMGDWA